MKIRKEIKIKERRQSFVEWILYSPTAYTITFRMALLLPPILMVLLLLYTVTTRSTGWSIVSTFMLVLTLYNLWRHRDWFKYTPDVTIGRTIWKIEDEEEEKKDG